MTEINLIKVNGKPLEKLVEVISQGIGTLHEPRRIRKKADADAYKIGIIEKAKALAAAESNDIRLGQIKRMEERTFHKELQRQENVEKINQIAAQSIQSEETVSEEPVDKDWTTRFFNIAEDVSSEEMQNLWGQILAGEVKTPGSYSLRTLETLKNLSQKEAKTFLRFASLAITGNKFGYVLRPKNKKTLETIFNLSFSDILLLQELGLACSASNLIVELSASTEFDRTYMGCVGDTVVVGVRKIGTPKQIIDVYFFTEIGLELLQLMPSTTPSIEYLQLIKEGLVHEKVEIKYGKILKKHNNGSVAHSPLVELK